MKEKFPVPQVDRLVGNETLVTQNFQGYLDDNGLPVTDSQIILKRLFEEAKVPFDAELSKTEKDISIIKHAEAAVREYAIAYGRSSLPEISLGHIHFLEDGGVEKFTKGRLAIGSHATILGQILVDRRGDLETAITTFHELWHTLGSYLAVQVTTDQKLDWYRSGFGMKSRDGKKESFYHLNEAITGYMTHKYVYEKLRNTELFKNEIDESVKNSTPIDTTRQRELNDLLKVIDNLLLKNKGRFSNREEIVDLFIRAQVTGNVLSVARLIEETYGKGTFRKLADF